MTDIISTGAKVLGLTSAGIFAGYTYGLSRATIPTILDHGLAPTQPDSERVVLAQWRRQYVDGASFSRPCCAIQILCFGYLAYSTPSVFASALYGLAAVMTGSGVPYALSFLRRTNGALSIKARRLAGKYFLRGTLAGKGDEELKPMAITYASLEGRSIRRENGTEDARWKSTRELVLRWKWHNDIRSVVLVLGTVFGAWAAAIDK